MRAPEDKCEKSLIKITLERLIKIPLEGNFCRFPRESEKSRTKAVEFLKSPEIPLEDTYFTPLHVADWPRVHAELPNITKQDNIVQSQENST